MGTVDGCEEVFKLELYRDWHWLMFALIKNKLPDFRPIFETYALDLKKRPNEPGHHQAESPPGDSAGT